MKSCMKQVIVAAVFAGCFGITHPARAMPAATDGGVVIDEPRLADPIDEVDPVDDVACVIDDIDVEVAEYVGPEGVEVLSTMAAFAAGGSPVDHVSKAMLVKLCVEQFGYPEKVCQNLAALVGGAGCKALKGTLNHCLRHPNEKRCKKPMIEFLLAGLNKFCPGWICR